MNIQPIVEGYGEVEAVPVLLRRLRDIVGEFDINISSPIRKTRPQLVDADQIRLAVKLAKKQEGCAAILILFDADDDCPKTIGPKVLKSAQDEAGGMPLAVVLAKREYEAWFLATIESLRGTRGVRDDASSHEDPEAPRGAKAHLESRMQPRRSYSETVDQAALSQKFDMAAAHRACRSFRKLVKAFGELVTSLGASLPDRWPPTDRLPQTQP